MLEGKGETYSCGGMVMSMSCPVVLKGLLKSQGGGHPTLRAVKAPQGLIAKPYTGREEQFYQHASETAIGSLIPKFHGTVVWGGEKWILLEDLTKGMRSPCIADLKLGTRSFEVDAPLQKQERQITHTEGTTTRTHAVRLIDVAIRKDGDVVRRWNRWEGRQIGADELRNILQTFVNGRTKEFLDGVETLRRKLTETYEKTPNLRLYSASVLAVYDGDSPQPPLRVSLIDFAHAYIDVGKEGGDPNDQDFDDNALKGLKSLINFMRDVSSS
jgi:hypothetical protein